MMMTKKRFCVGMLAALLASVVLLVGCPDGRGDGEEGWVDHFIETPRAPFFLRHPTSAVYPAGTQAAEFTQLVAQVRLWGGDTAADISWQWYRTPLFMSAGGTPIAGAINPTFQPDAPGIFYVVATVYRDGEPVSRTSHPASVRVGALPPYAGTLTVTDRQRQYIRGFGGMSNGFWIGDDHGNTRPQMYMRRRDIVTMFDPEGQLAFNMLRIHVFPAPGGVADVISGAYRADWPEMAVSNRDFAWHARQVSEFGGFVIAAPWTPADYTWKGNRDLYGVATGYGDSNLLREHYEDYALYLRDWAFEMADFDAPIFAISVQNEPTYGPNYYGMLWTESQHEEFLRVYGHLITRANIPGSGGNLPWLPRNESDFSHVDGQRVLLQGGSPHNNILWNDVALNSPLAREHLEIVAYHTYGAWNTRHALSLGPIDGPPPPLRRETWMMEKNLNHGTGPGQYIDSTWNLIWPLTDEIHHVIAHNESSAYVWWYLKRFYSMIGEGAQGTTDGAILPRGFAMGHFSRFFNDTMRVEASLDGRISAGIGPGNQGHLPLGATQATGEHLGIRVLAGIRETNPSTMIGRGEGFGNPDLDRILGGIRDREDMVSILVYDNRTNLPGVSTNIRVQLPDNFVADSAYGIISSPAQRHAPVLVYLESCGTMARVNLPTNALVSLRFRGDWN